jgi:hypothetical protein
MRFDGVAVELSSQHQAISLEAQLIAPFGDRSLIALKPRLSAHSAVVSTVDVVAAIRNIPKSVKYDASVYGSSGLS